jgi:hypothetical protein
MSRESQDRINHYADLIENGGWQQAVELMSLDDMSFTGIMEFCQDINFYPDEDFKDYARKLTARRDNAKNKEALDDFFSKVKI